jgi:hypothetical protein
MHGHTIDDPGTEFEIIEPYGLPGSIGNFHAPTLRTFVSTPSAPPMGMCGCPVVLEQTNNVCIGIVEGLVQGSKIDGLVDTTAVIEAWAVQHFLDSIEVEMIKTE